MNEEKNKAYENNKIVSIDFGKLEDYKKEHYCDCGGVMNYKITLGLWKCQVCGKTDVETNMEERNE